jgi:pyruvate carboxylase subunit B
VRFLKEDPWERLRKLRPLCPIHAFQMLLRGQNLLGYRHYPDDLVRAFVQKSADNGVDVFRVFDAMNDIRNMQNVSIEAVKEAGKHAEGTLSYTTSPVHDTPTSSPWRVVWKTWAATPSREGHGRIIDAVYTTENWSSA